MKNYFPLLCIFLILVSCPSAFSQVQLGADIDGEAAGDLSGFSVSMSADGSRLAVGAPWNSDNGAKSGHVRVYDWNGAGWEQLGMDINGEFERDQSGFRVSLSADGSRLAVSAIGLGNDSNLTGYLRVYGWDGTGWARLGTDIIGAASGSQSGTSLSLSADGNRVAAGSVQNVVNGIVTGNVRVYGWNETDWQQLGMDIDGEELGEQFGSSVSLSADGVHLAVGARFNNASGGNSGKVRVYEWDGTDWIRLGTDIDGEATGDQSGWSVSLSFDGRRLAVGAPPNDGNGDNSGHVKVYEWEGTDWAQLGSDIDGEAAGDRSGGSVSLSADGNRLAVGATSNDGNGSNAGHVRLYDWNGMEWSRFGEDIDGETAGDEWGYSVSLSADGSRLSAGSINNDQNGEDAGQVRVYGFAPSAVTNTTPAGLVAFPNPATGEIHFSAVDIDRVQVFDVAGRLLMNVERPGQTLDLSAMPSGMCLLKFTAGSKAYAGWVIKQ